MSKSVILKLESGDFEQGFSVKLKIGEVEIESKLPSALRIIEDYESWRLTYQQLKLPLRKQFKRQKRPETINLNENCRNAAQILSNSMKAWLNSSELSNITERFSSFKQSEEIRVLIQAENPQLWQLPWHRWDVFERYPNAEVALSSPVSRRIERRTLAQPRTKVRILAIQGDSTAQDDGTKIYPDADIKLLHDLLPEKEAEVVLLEEPERRDLYDRLWDEQGWDIIFFAGHSSTDWYLNQAGRIFINSRDSLTIPQLKSALRSANALGLKLAIFNSCDGLGLAKNLADLQIPNVVVMREPIPDPVAQAFVKDFLERFAGGESLYASVRQAREGLQQLEQQFPCASWLPVICQNPADEPLTWRGLLTNIAAETNWEGCCRTLLTLDALKRLQSNMLTKDKGMEIEDIYVPPSLGLVQRQEPKDQEQPNLSTLEYKITRNYQQHEFFEQVLRRGKSPNSKGRRLAIIGEAGIGKTLLLQRIGDWVTWVLDNTKQVVIWVSLADLRRGQSLKDYLLEDWLTKAMNQVKMSWATQKTLVRLFIDGNVWLLLDGADETPVYSGNSLEEISRQITDSDWISQARVVLTCRLNVWEANKNTLQNFDVYRNLDFRYDNNNDQVENFIRCWFPSNKEQGEQLRQALDQEGKQRIKDLARNPLRLSLLCLVWEEQGRLPETKAELYRQFIEAIYKWKQARFPLDESKKEGLNRGLAKLAKWTLEQKQSLFVEWAIQVVEQSQLPLAKRALAKLTKRKLALQDSPFRIPHSLASSALTSDLPSALKLGWLNQVGVAKNNTQNPIYAFFHPSLHEYFAAQSINSTDWQYFLDHHNFFTSHPAYGTYRVFEQQWQEVILFWLGREDVPESFKERFIEHLLMFEDKCGGFYKIKAKFLAAVCIGEFKSCSNSLARAVLSEVVRESFVYYNDPNDFWFPYKAVRYRAYKALLQTDETKAKDLLLRLLSRVRADYIATLSDIAEALERLDHGNQAAINVHLKLMQFDKDSIDSIDISFSSMEALWKTARGNAEAIKTLNDRLDFEQDEHKRAMFAATLGIIASGKMAEKAINTLIEILFITSKEYAIDSYFKEIAINNLDADVLKKIVEKLKYLLQTIQYQDLPWHEKSKIPWYEKSGLCDSYAFTRYQRMRLYAAKNLLKINPNSSEAVTTLIKLMHLDTGHNYFIDNVDADLIRRRAAETLEELGSDNSKVVSALSECVANTESDEALRLAINVLGEVASASGNSGAIKALSQRIQRVESPWIRKQIAEILGKVYPGSLEAINNLIELMQTTEQTRGTEQIRLAAAESLGAINPGSSEAIKTLIEIQETSQEQLVYFIQELGISQENVWSCIYKLLKESDDNRRDCSRTNFLREVLHRYSLLKDSTKSLGKIAHSNLEAISALTKLLHNQDEEICLEAAKSLAEIDPGNIEALNTLITLHRKAQKESRHDEAGVYFQLLAKKIPEISDCHRRSTLLNAVTEIMKSHPNEYQQYEIAKVLGQVAPGNAQLISTLVDRIENSKKLYIPDVLQTLKRFLQYSQLQQIVSTLKELLEEAHENDSERFDDYLEIFFHCADNLSYPEFYQYWHRQSATYHLQPRLFFGVLTKSYLSIWIKIAVRFKYPSTLLFDSMRLILWTSRHLFLVILLPLCFPLFLISSLISPCISRLLKREVDLSSSLGKLIGFIIGSILFIPLFSLILLICSFILIISIVLGIPFLIFYIIWEKSTFLRNV